MAKPLDTCLPKVGTAILDGEGTYTDRDHNALKWMAEEAVVAKSQHSELDELSKTHKDAWMRGYWIGRLEALRLQALHVYGLTEDKWRELVDAAV